MHARLSRNIPWLALPGARSWSRSLIMTGTVNVTQEGNHQASGIVGGSDPLHLTRRGAPRYTASVRAGAHPSFTLPKKSSYCCSTNDIMGRRRQPHPPLTRGLMEASPLSARELDAHHEYARSQHPGHVLRSGQRCPARQRADSREEDAPPSGTPQIPWPWRCCCYTPRPLPPPESA